MRICTLLLAAVAFAQQRAPIGIPHVNLGEGPWVFDTAEQHKIRVSVVARGLSHPWSVAFLPGGDMLVTERAGRLRIIHDGKLDSQPVAGVPKVHAISNAGLFDIALHPKFSENKLIYFTYTKPGENRQSAIALGRGRLDGSTLSEVRELFAGEWTTLLGGSRIAFARDGTIFMTTGARRQRTRRRIPIAITERFSDSKTMARSHPTILSSARAGISPKCTRSAIAISWALRSIRTRVRCFRMKTDRTAATR